MNRRISFCVAAAIVAGGALVTAVSAAAGNETRPIAVPLTYAKITASDLYVFGRSVPCVVFTSKAPEGAWTLPDFGERKPAFAMIRLGDKERLMALDHVYEPDVSLDTVLAGFGEKTPTAAKFYNRLYFDTNANGDLTDDPVIQATAAEVCGDSGKSVFVVSDATVMTREGVLPYGFHLSVHGPASTKPEGTIGLLCPMCIYSGSGELAGGAEYRVTLADANVNGSFSDCMTDWLCFSDDRKIPDRYVLRFASNVVIGATSYQAEFKAAAGKLILTPVEGATRLRLSGNAETLILQSDKPGKGVSMFHPAQDVSVAQGTYSLLAYQMSRTDEKGRLWILCANGTAQSKPVVTAPDRTMPMTFGEPFDVELACRSSKTKSGEMIAMNLAAVGSDNERVAIPACLDKASSKAHLRSAAQFPRLPPRYEVTDSRGAQVAKGQFEVCCGGACSATWSRSPTETNETYYAECQYESFPFELRRQKQALKW